MSTPTGHRKRPSLFNLLPALYSPARRAACRKPPAMKSARSSHCSSIVEEQLAIVEENLDQLYDDQFIETCAPWVIPYIGDLIGYQSINGIASAVDSPRAEVANTIGFRRRKGTVPVLEQLARDATGWGAHAVEFFLVLATTQCIRNHVRLQNYYAPDLRRWQPREFTWIQASTTQPTKWTCAASPSARARPLQHPEHRHLPLVAQCLHAHTCLPPTAVSGSPQCFRFSPLGADMPLFHKPIALPAETTTLAQPANVPDRLHRHVLCKDIRDITEKSATPVYYGPGLSLAIYRDALAAGCLAHSGQRSLRQRRLLGQPAPFETPANTIAVDPRLGRIAISAVACRQDAPHRPRLLLRLQRRPSAAASIPAHPPSPHRPEQAIVRVPGDYPPRSRGARALSGDGVVEVTNSGFYSEPAASPSTSAPTATSNSAPPTARAPPSSSETKSPSLEPRPKQHFDLNGFLIAYAPQPPAHHSAAFLHAPSTPAETSSPHLGLTHCTLAPGWALQTEWRPRSPPIGLPACCVEISGLGVQIQRNPSSALSGSMAESTASLTDSILDATDPTGVAYVASIDTATDAPVCLRRAHHERLHRHRQGLCLAAQPGDATASSWAELTAADVSGTPPLWNAPLWAARRQQGCVRFSYLPAGAIVPRQFQCVEQAPGTPRPCFIRSQYGNPAYAKLLPTTDSAIRQGADDGGEMGAFHFLLAPLREADLRIRLAGIHPRRPGVRNFL